MIDTTKYKNAEKLTNREGLNIKTIVAYYY